MEASRKLVAIYFVWLVVEGAVRKWVLPEFSSEIFLVKDLLLVSIFVYAFGALAAAPHVRAALAVTVFSAAFFVALFLVQPISMLSMIGLRYYLSCLPLMALAPLLIQDLEDLERFGRWSLVGGVLTMLLAAVQYFSPAESDINRYVWGQEVAMFGVSSTETQLFAMNRPRVTSTFSYITPFALFLQIIYVVAWVSLLAVRKGQLLIAAVIAMVLVSMTFTGSRGPLIFALVAGVTFLAFGIRHRVGRIAVGLAGGGAVLLAGGLLLFGEAFDLLLTRAMEAEDYVERLWAFVEMPFVTLADASAAGAGMGRTFVGLSQLASPGASGVDTGFRFEVHDPAGFELGAGAYLFVLGFKIVLLILTLKLCVRAEDIRVKTWALGSFVVQISTGWIIPFHSTIANAAYWSAIGLFFWLGQWTRAQRLLRNRNWE